MIEKGGFLKNQKGFSLVELLISSAMGVVVLIGATILLVQFTKANWYARHTSDEWSKVQLANETLPKYLGPALNVDWTGTPIASVGAGRGQLLNFTSGFNPIRLRPYTVGLFLREAGHPSPSNTGSDIRGTALFFVDPSVRESGQLIISTTDQGTGPADLSSDNGILTFDSIVEMSISPAGFPSVPGDPVRAARLSIVFRRFIDPQQDQWQFCPEAQIATRVACQTKARFVDETLLLDIPFVNNTIQTDFGTTETLYGNIYFFGQSGGTN